ncbi:MAG TPA: rod shape-determining protein RodA [Prolixibacteraceae bacterium]|nr:rod shape-determining protein RodA [Prolixibacteraceae bacterium]
MAQRNKLWANIDWVTVMLAFGLMFLGWINIYAAVYNEEHSSIFDVTQRYGKQLIWIGAAVFLGMVILITDSNFYLFFSWPIYGLVIFSLVLVLVAGVEINGSKSWFVIGGDLRLQPAEFAKFATALALAKLMSSYNFKMQKAPSVFLIATIIGLPPALIMLQPDTGSAIVFVVFFLVLYREGMSGVILFFGFLTILLFLLSLLTENFVLLILLFVGSIIAFYVLNPRFKLALSGLGLGIGLTLLLQGVNLIAGNTVDFEWIILAGTLISMIVFVIYSLKVRMRRAFVIIGIFFGSVLFTYSVDFVFENILQAHQQARINELLGLQSDPLGAGYNVNQSKIAIGSGGFSGKGFLNGTQTKFNFVPEQSTDFIFCTVGEEWGFFGSLVVIGLFLALLIRVINLAERQRSLFSRVYGYSVASILFFHFAVNIGMTIGLMPVIGIPLPFFSYGGSSLWAFTVLLFVFLRLDASRLDRLV